MKNRIKIFTLVVLSVFLIFISDRKLWWYLPSENAVKNAFSQNEATLLSTADYLKQLPYYQINTAKLGSNSSELNVTTILPSGFVDIKQIHLLVQNPLIHHHADFLKKLIISKRVNSIYFQFGERYPHTIGIVYSMNGKKPYDGNLVKLIPLKDKNWYVYREDEEKEDEEYGG